MKNIIGKFEYILKLPINAVSSLLNYIKNKVRMLISIINCLNKFKNGNVINITDIKKLKDIYPDMGGLSRSDVFYKDECPFDLSIIIPMYNCANYINECIESVLTQVTGFSYEIILINDGSTDDTIGIIKNHINNPQIKLINQENHGQSYARNRAIEQAKGKYLMMLDADDILLPGCIDTLVSAARKTGSDISEGRYIRFVKKETLPPLSATQKSPAIISLRAEKSKKYLLTGAGYSFAKVYNRNLWSTLRFPEGYIFEDVITKFILRRKANQIVYIDSCIYGYRQNSESSSHKMNGMKHLDSIWVYDKIYSLCKSEGIPFDDVFYLLSLNHIAILNYVTMSLYEKDIRLSCFVEMQRQLKAIQYCRPKRIPLMFRILERSILEGKLDAWEQAAKTVIKYKMLKNLRET